MNKEQKTIKIMRKVIKATLEQVKGSCYLEKERMKIEIEVIKLANCYPSGNAFLVCNGDSQKFWELVKVATKIK